MTALDDVKALSLAVERARPTAAARLAGLGAWVNKVRAPAATRSPPPTAWYDELRAGQQVVTLDLKQAADRARLDELLEPPISF